MKKFSQVPEDCYKKKYRFYVSKKELDEYKLHNEADFFSSVSIALKREKLKAPNGVRLTRYCPYWNPTIKNYNPKAVYRGVFIEFYIMNPTQNNMKEDFESTLPSTCDKCKKNNAQPDHLCPYAEELDSWNKGELCNCCEDCQHQCALDI